MSLLDAQSYPELLKKNASTRNMSTEDELSSEASQPPTQQPHPPEFRILVTKSEILDKSKSDALGKLFTVLQTTSFIVQYMDRWVAHQPRTQLEVMTLAYSALNILVYILWWDKPLNVQEPIDVRGRASAPLEDRTKGMNGAWYILGDAWASLQQGNAAEKIIEGRTGLLSLAVMLPVVGIIFGGVHCLAWQFPFPTGQEKVLWRVCAVYCTAGPFLSAVAPAIFSAPYAKLPQHINIVLKGIRYFFFELDCGTLFDFP
jgi:hypothetical protein